MNNYFTQFRNNIIGINQKIKTPNGEFKQMIYSDWTASGRNYLPIEERFIHEVLPFVANTHTDTNTSGKTMTYAYHEAQKIIKKHVNAGPNDILISSNSGMTGVVNKFQRILGLKVHESHRDQIKIKEEDKAVVFITHMEHHSNQTSWLETLADVVIVDPDENGLVSPENFRLAIEKYPNRKMKIAAVTSCSNVTGIVTPYHEIAKMIHAAGGYCFADFACSAPYVDINMHPEDPEAYLDAIYFSPHKFLGGPGSAGILIFNSVLYKNEVPDTPGGGTVEWTNPWGGHKYIEDIEAREDGGTPGFLQTMRTAMAIVLKEQMGTKNIHQREEEQMAILWSYFEAIPNLNILASQHKKRLGIISFYIDGLHYNLAVKMLNDRYGIQTRGGCSCAGTYGHYLLHVDQQYSNAITNMIDKGDYSQKPGWVRLSIHPIMTDEELHFIGKAVTELAANHQEWAKDYDIDLSHMNLKYKHEINGSFEEAQVEKCFSKF